MRLNHSLLAPLFINMDDASPDETATSTRVFVSGLPPMFTSDDLRKHFSQKHTATDAHVFPDRRIGFVGFRDHETASAAVRYFNRSFIRMSKIAVSLARPIDIKRDANGQAAPVSQRRDRSQRQTDANSAKKRKRDAHDDGETDRSAQINHSASTVEPESAPDAHAAISDGNEEAFEGFGSDEEPTQDDEQVKTTTSDSDWLRGKTSRILDLQDPEKEPMAPNIQPDPRSPSPPAENSAEPRAEIDVDKSPEHLEETVKVPNGRLFVRNLAFDVSEAELESLFLTHGKIIEVRRLRYSLIPIS